MARLTPAAIFEPFRRSGGAARCCQYPGCEEDGIYRAPMSPALLDDYYWFCLTHVRDYNKAWNYYAGMSENEVEYHRRQDTVWRRPTWPVGGQALRHQRRIEEQLRRDFAGVFEEGTGTNHATRPLSEQDKALSILDLEPEADITEIKARYKKLVKRLHPDANGGDRAAEEHLKAVNQAYATLKNGCV
jgi:hypothetical protein